MLKRTASSPPLLQERFHGKVAQVVGLVIEGFCPDTAVGSLCEIHPQSGPSIPAEVVGFRDNKTLLMPLGELRDVGERRLALLAQSAGRRPSSWPQAIRSSASSKRCAIGRKMGMEVELVQRKDYEEVNALLKKNLLDVAFVCTGAYVAGRDDFGMDNLDAPVTQGRTVYYSYVIVPVGSPVRSFEELEGRTFAFTDEDPIMPETYAALNPSPRLLLGPQTECCVHAPAEQHLRGNSRQHVSGSGQHGCDEILGARPPHGSAPRSPAAARVQVVVEERPAHSVRLVHSVRPLTPYGRLAAVQTMPLVIDADVHWFQDQRDVVFFRDRGAAAQAGDDVLVQFLRRARAHAGVDEPLTEAGEAAEHGHFVEGRRAALLERRPDVVRPRLHGEPRLVGKSHEDQRRLGPPGEPQGLVAAAEADVFPVDAQTIAFAPASAALATATTMPRSLNEPVGFWPSILRYRLDRPIDAPSRVACTSGVAPSPRLSSGVSGVIGRKRR